VGLAGLGLFLLSPNWILRIKLVFILLLFWLINPTMTHLVAKASLIQGIKPVANTRLRKG
jgi:multisubunit Na+/H+ antiporter MnhG subunit